MSALSVGDQVQFRENDEHQRVLGVVSRVWPNGRDITLISDGRTFVRSINNVTPCTKTEIPDARLGAS